MIELIIDFPGNSSRTSTPAMMVPKTAVTPQTAPAAPNVTLRAAAAAGAVYAPPEGTGGPATESGAKTALKNVLQPPSVERTNTAASGRSTTRLRYVMTSPGATLGSVAPRPPCRGAATVLLGSADTEARLDRG